MDPGTSEKRSNLSLWSAWIGFLLALVGWVIAVGGAVGFFASQVRIPGASTWPLPGLILLDWALAGLPTLVACAINLKSAPGRWIRAAWFGTGMLLPLIILGAFSIGPLVLITFLSLLAASVLLTMQKGSRWLESLGLLLLGAICNVGFWVLLFIISS